jgi:hypothetical protein
MAVRQDVLVGVTSTSMRAKMRSIVRRVRAALAGQEHATVVALAPMRRGLSVSG